MRGIVILLSSVLVVVSGPLLALAYAPPPQEGMPVLVVGSDPAGLVAGAGGFLIGPETAPFAAVAYGDAGFLERLQASEVWLVRDGQWIARICGGLE